MLHGNSRPCLLTVMANVKDSADMVIRVDEDSPPHPYHSSDDAFPLSYREEVCIYRVRPELSRATPDAFTPHMLLIGPLQYFKKKEASSPKLQGWASPDIQNVKDRYDMYRNMEVEKKNYREQFEARVCDESMFTKIEDYFKQNEEKIRRSYAEPTGKIPAAEFADMIFQDAIFIIELFLKRYEKEKMQWSGDMLIDDLQDIVYEDLILLENQLPYFLLEGVYQLIQGFVPSNPGSQRMEKPTFRDLTLTFFDIKYLPEDTTFRHFTDLIRVQRVLTAQSRGDKSKSLASVATKDKHKEQSSEDTRGDERRSELLYSAEKLQQSGIDFVLAEAGKGPSIKVEFEGRRLSIGRLAIDNSTEKILRNIIALECAHYPKHMYVSSYVKLLALLVDTERDVDLLEDEGIIRGRVGYRGSVVDMINSLTNGLQFESCYSDITANLESYYKSSWQRTFGMLRRVYFPNVLTGTGSVAAAIVVVLGFIDTVSGILQLRQR